MVSVLASVSDETNTHNLDDRLGFYKEILNGMTPEERSQPEYFKGTGADVQARIARVAENSGHGVKSVEQFLVDFNTMHTILSELGSGKSFDAVTKKLTLSKVHEQLEGKSRRTRRQTKSLKRGKKSA